MIDRIGDDENPDNPENPVKKDLHVSTRSTRLKYQYGIDAR